MQTITLDGFTFNLQQDPGYVAYLEMARRARNGDQNATTLLNTFNVSIQDNNGQYYWPLNMNQSANASGS